MSPAGSFNTGLSVAVGDWYPVSMTAPDRPLDLRGKAPFVDEAGHGVEFIVVRTEGVARRPHGLSYTSTLYVLDGEGLAGFDDACPAWERTRPGTRRRRESGHRHRRRSVKPYSFRDPATLPEDFWSEMDAVLNKGDRCHEDVEDRYRRL